MKLGLWILSLALFSQTAAAFNVFGWDDREQKDVDSGVYRKVVFINSCTGSLVWKNLVLTAAHCVESMVTKQTDGSYRLNGTYYVESRKNGARSAAKAKVVQLWWGTLDHNTNRWLDWAIVRVDKNLADGNGHFGHLADLSATSPHNHSVQNASFASDIEDAEGGAILTGPRRDCRIREHATDTNLVYHDCDTSRGSSGSPIWVNVDGDDRIIALHVAEFRGNSESTIKVSDRRWNEARNVAINVRAFGPKITEIRALYPKGADSVVTTQPASRPAASK